MTTKHRFYIDKFLNSQKKYMQGAILDIGGKKDNKRGNFAPPYNLVKSWKFLNNDKSTNPDYYSNAEIIPLGDLTVDGFLMCELLEHLENPEKVLSEAHRVLKKGGKGWITMPFLYQIHPDPKDYQRWTKYKLEQTLKSIGFSKIHIEPMGGVISIILDLWYAILERTENKKKVIYKFSKILFKFFSIFLWPFEKKLSFYSKWMTTGWSIVVEK